MAGIRDLTQAWSSVTEVDVRPLREQAERGVNITLVGRPGSGRHALAEQMRRDPSRPDVTSAGRVRILDLDSAAGALKEITSADLIILMMDPAIRDDKVERTRVREWVDAGYRVLVLINRAADFTALEAGGLALQPWLDWGKRHVLVGPADDPAFLIKEFVPAVMRLLPELLLALGRNFALFRVPIARHLINDSSFTNAAYSFGTGVAEIVPVLNIPMNVTDVIILTKNQIFLVYKIGLTLGMPTDLQSYFTTFGGILGAGFFWRQAARSLVGLIPAWGIIPKVGIAYAGTEVVGTAVLHWYLTGRHISREQIRQLYRQASDRAKKLIPRFRRRKQQLAEGKPKRERRLKRGTPPLEGSGQVTAALPASTLATSTGTQNCPSCGRLNAADASFCQYCGQRLAAQPAA